MKSALGFFALLSMCLMLPGVVSWMTEYDQPFTFTCDDNHMLQTIESEHSSRTEDRVWNFTCVEAPPNTRLDGCEWSGMLTHGCEYTDFENDYDQPLLYSVPEGMVLRGITSIHSNSKEDRIFRFDICKLDPAQPGPGIGK
ncbi:hemagglutinin/amebocyte aggregation factor [Plakobranchus ocellatus]|uniref:Hemagglutinin/amebocyte aggregation factor n=1 Tax=Plakobranchus ocellatus TaxID=259542 RepID=A0AAV4DNG7_9GAST|nr:hemagglutinin/amebocyte aggregation factor [Plakobranchus ocellatus]